ncbi:MAG: cobalamin B12-binding domain-containing protein [Candidatus Nitrosocosmicus sp.]
MVFIRVKKVKGLDYYYLIKSKWDRNRKKSKQQIIKYLGNVHNFTIEDIPLEYRNNPNILSKLLLKTQERQEKFFLIKELKRQVFKSLRNGEVDKILKIVEKYEKQTSLSEFYDDILKQVMYEVGELWQQNKLDVGTEHVCSNIANQTIHIINKRYNRRHKKDSVLICTPEGEIHNISCNVIESILLEKGFHIYNISPSIPSDSIIKYIKDINPSMILISVTLVDNLGSAKRLIKKISAYTNIPMIIGGQAINNLSKQEQLDIDAVNPNVKIFTDHTLKTLPKNIKVLIKDNYNNI